ncbi:hypothetical protein AN958_00709 [Leucoagaricus sp. SymC.cos]|nr:hypothetical protein AN958_00709 [Leucoagaricus sp. SymC.cos]
MLYGHEQQSANIKRTRVTSYLRLFLFFFIEAGFIILAAVCLAKPVPLNLPLRFSDSEVKGGFTVVFIVWHSLAIMTGGQLLADAFSREWSVQLANIVPGTTDRVSTVTSGFLDRIFYLFTKRASAAFKLAFLASLSFMALTQLAPGTISAATTLVDIPIMVNVGTLVSQITDLSTFLTSQTRAALIVRLEMIERSPFGLKLPPNTLVTLPSAGLGEFDGTMEYDSDVVEFHHSCHWEAPSIANASSIQELVVLAANQVWSTTLTVGPQGTPGSSISPLSLLTPQIMENVSTSAYLFIGGNSTFPNSRTTPTTPFAIDLGNLPALFLSQGIGVIAGSDIDLIAPLASVLVCDPQAKITGGRISISSGGTVSIIASGQPPIGNFPQSAANLILSNAFQVALVQLEPLELSNLVNNVASALFMANASGDWNKAQNISPLDIPTLNENVDMFMSSAAKAFLDGYRKDGTSVSPTFDTNAVSGMGQEQRLALTTSKGLFITTIVVDAIALALLYALCRSALTQKRYPFDLMSVFHVLSEDNGRRASQFIPTQPRG